MNINPKPFRVLSIDPGTRYLGVALFDNNCLVYRAVKTIQKRNGIKETLTEVEKIVSNLFEEYNPDVLVQEKPYYVQSKTSAKKRKITQLIKKLSLKNQLIYYDYSPPVIKKAICNNDKATKQDVAKIISEQFHDMAIYLKQNRAWQDRYFMNIFDAVALGLCFIQKKFP